jgi:hypothetical protein
MLDLSGKRAGRHQDVMTITLHSPGRGARALGLAMVVASSCADLSWTPRDCHRADTLPSPVEGHPEPNQGPVNDVVRHHSPDGFYAHASILPTGSEHGLASHWTVTKVADFAGEAVSWICASHPASVIPMTLSRRAWAASCDTARPVTSSRTAVVTSAELRIVNR